jgi:hypothetical protein
MDFRGTHEKENPCGSKVQLRASFPEYATFYTSWIDYVLWVVERNENV